MSKLTTFQELRHKCAKLYCPNEVDKKQAINDIAGCYNVDKDIIDKTVQFQKDNGIVED